MEIQRLIKYIGALGISGLSLMTSAQEIHKKKCSHTERETLRAQQNPNYLKQKKEAEELIQEVIKHKRHARVQENEVYTIPVVVHVIYHKDRPEENISDARILSQIDVLNEDFSKQNSNFSQTPSVFQDVAADVGIRFKLAELDPNGNATTGITRTQTTIDEIGETQLYYSTEDGGKDAWDVTQYLNIWVCDLADGLLGFAYFANGGVFDDDGMVIAHEFFGRQAGTGNLGRTATHEIGHYFNLNHIWGEGCSTDDGISDTPDQEEEYYGCPNHPSVSCGSQDMFVNYMDYVDDDCMTMFTKGQKEKMVTTLTTLRSGLISSKGLVTSSVTATNTNTNLYIAPNPTQGAFSIQATESKEVDYQIYSAMGSLVAEGTSMTNEPISTSLPTGVYNVRILEEENVYTEKLIIQQ